MERVNVSWLIKFNRFKNGLYQKDLAKMIGISEKAIVDIENSKVSIKLCNLEKIANALGLTLDELIVEKVNGNDR